jgi:hypothetical protein
MWAIFGVLAAVVAGFLLLYGLALLALPPDDVVELARRDRQRRRDEKDEVGRE